MLAYLQCFDLNLTLKKNSKFMYILLNKYEVDVEKKPFQQEKSLQLEQNIHLYFWSGFEV